MSKQSKFNDIHNIHDYKVAKALVKELPEVIQDLTQALLLLNKTKYRKFTPIRQTIEDIKYNKAFLEMQLTKCQKIVANKGKVS